MHPRRRPRSSCPLIQDYAFLSLEPIQIEIPLKGALSIENIRVNVPSVFTVAIGTDPDTMQNAAIRLLGLNTDEVKQQAQDIIFGQLRQVIASMRIEDINRDRDKFLQSIQNSLEPELEKIGLVLINVNITDITDECGYIEAIGRKAAAEAIQQAKVDVAEQEKSGQIGVAEAERERAISVANATKAREIGTREALRDQAIRLAAYERDQAVAEQTALLDQEVQVKEAQRQQAIKVAELDRDQKVGEQAAVFEREAKVAEADRDKRVRLADANAKAIGGEATAQADIAAAQATLAVRKAEAYQLSETKKREAEAAVQEAQNRAMAKAALADAERIEAEQRAAVEAPAKAEKAKTIVEAEAAAEKAKIEAKAEAAAIFARLEAEARGQYEILAKKGEGLQDDHRGVRRRPAGVPAADAGAPGQAGRGVRQGDLEHQVRQGGGLGGRRQRHRGRVEHGRVPAEHGPEPAADDAGDEGHRRGGGAGVPGAAPGRRADADGRAVHERGDGPDQPGGVVERGSSTLEPDRKRGSCRQDPRLRFGLRKRSTHVFPSTTSMPSTRGRARLPAGSASASPRP